MSTYNKAAIDKYRATTKGREATRRANAKYQATPKGKEAGNRAVRKARRKRKLRLLDGRDRCERCGFADVRALQFHHPDPALKVTKLGDYARVTDAMLAEARACEVLCANCHSIHHFYLEDEAL